MPTKPTPVLQTKIVNKYPPEEYLRTYELPEFHLVIDRIANNQCTVKISKDCPEYKDVVIMLFESLSVNQKYMNQINSIKEWEKTNEEAISTRD